MEITVNGESRAVAEGCTVAGLIEELGLAKAICAAEVNRAVVPRAERGARVLEPGDRVEIVTLVGGG
jgi:thiamine biosynthesis protein ThiS